MKVHDLGLFQRFLVLCAARSGQLLNISSLSSDSGVSEAQCRRWLTVLQASELVFLLQPFHENLGKRLTKAPKLYFTDTGVLCRLLGIDSAETLSKHSSLGAIFETFIVIELRKCILNRGERPSEYFWRDSTLSGDHFRNLTEYFRLRGPRATVAWLAYGGDGEGQRKDVTFLPWWKI